AVSSEVCNYFIARRVRPAKTRRMNSILAPACTCFVAARLICSAGQIQLRQPHAENAKRKHRVKLRVFGVLVLAECLSRPENLFAGWRGRFRSLRTLARGIRETTRQRREIREQLSPHRSLRGRRHRFGHRE